MGYNEILKQLAIKENKTEKEIENAMQQAINRSGLECTAKEFIQIASFFINKRRYIA